MPMPTLCLLRAERPRLHGGSDAAGGSPRAGAASRPVWLGCACAVYCERCRAARRGTAGGTRRAAARMRACAAWALRRWRRPRGWSTILVAGPPCSARRAQAAAPRRSPLIVQNIRVNNVEIPNSKRIEISLQYIYGIGQTTAQTILRNTVRSGSSSGMRRRGPWWLWPAGCGDCGGARLTSGGSGAAVLLAQGLENKKTYELNEEEINKIREEVGKFTTEADLVRSLRTCSGADAAWRRQGMHSCRSSSCSSCTATRANPAAECSTPPPTRGLRATCSWPAAPHRRAKHQAVEGHPVLPRQAPHHGERRGRAERAEGRHSTRTWRQACAWWQWAKMASPEPHWPAQGLPVRGQRTKTNARTRKGKAKTVAGKVGALELSLGGLRAGFVEGTACCSFGARSLLLTVLVGALRRRRPPGKPLRPTASYAWFYSPEILQPHGPARAAGPKRVFLRLLVHGGVLQHRAARPLCKLMPRVHAAQPNDQVRRSRRTACR